MSDYKKIDISKVKRSPKQQETRAFTDPLQPDQELVITLQFPVYFHESGGIVRRAQELLEFWREEESGLVRLPPVDGVQTTLDIPTAQAYATLELLQPQPPEYSFPELNALSVLMPSALAAASEWALSLLPNSDGVKRGRKIEKGSPSSRSPSTPNTATRNAGSGSTPSSARSTRASAISASVPAPEDDETLLQSLDASLMGSETAGSPTL